MTDENPAKTVSVEYDFKLLSGEKRRFQLELDEATLQSRQPVRATLPEWTCLATHQCPNCPLDPARHAHCPAAVSLSDLVETFRDGVSYEEADVHVRFMKREYRKRTPLQYGVSSLMGLHMATSGCPVLDKLRPMAHTHLPFASIRETLYRILSMYLLAQYFVQEEGGTPDWDLENLPQLFEEISLVNRSFSQRLSEVTRTSDAVNNALVNLDCFAVVTTLSVDGDVSKIRDMFRAWQEEARPGDTGKPAHRKAALAERRAGAANQSASERKDRRVTGSRTPPNR